MPSYRLLLIVPVLLCVGLSGAGCSKTPATPAASNDVSTGASAPAPLAAHAPAPSVDSPATAAGSSAATPGVLPAATAPGGTVPTATGKVVDTMDSGGYTYVRLDTGSQKLWAATAPIKVKVGQELTIPLEMPMQNFHSSTLKRDFPVIYFASRVARGGEPLPARGATPSQAGSGGQATPAGQAAPAGQMPPGHPPVGAGASKSMTVTEVIKTAPGGTSVADVWAKRASLSGKQVVVRGKVVKFLSGIMGKNWVHLQDGTGKAADGTNDLTVTTDGDAKVGDVLTATGTLAVDKDFGAGYKYGAIVEGATLAK
jgi:hypothetical protein